MKGMGVAILTGCLLLTGIVMGGMFTNGIIVKQAQARVGRPLTPGSVAGVARRTSRRVVRRTSVYVAALPGGCSTVVIEGVTLHQCGTTYYQAVDSQYVVVTID